MKTEKNKIFKKHIIEIYHLQCPNSDAPDPKHRNYKPHILHYREHNPDKSNSNMGSMIAEVKNESIENYCCHAFYSLVEEHINRMNNELSM